MVFDSALLAFREGLESILVLAAFTASFMGFEPVATTAGRRGAAGRYGHPGCGFSLGCIGRYNRRPFGRRL